MRQLIYQVWHTKYQVSFYLWQIGPVLKHCKVPKHVRDCLKVFLLLSTLSMMIQVSGKSAHLAQKKLVLSKKCQKAKLKAFERQILT